MYTFPFLHSSLFLQEIRLCFSTQLASHPSIQEDTSQAPPFLFSSSYKISPQCHKVNTLQETPPIPLDIHLQIASQGTFDPALVA